MSIIYQLSIRLYYFVAYVMALYSPKAKAWINGRKGLLELIKQSIEKDAKHVWFHCASLGEYEQAIPIIEAYHSKFPNEKIVVTFFSPSGYQHRKDLACVDHYFYLPIDTPKHALNFINLIRPTKAFFVKYEFWYYYLRQLKQAGIPTFLVSGVFREDQLFFKWYGQWYKKMLSLFTHIYVQDTASKQLLDSVFISNVSLSGDTRYDRVWKHKQSIEKIPLLEHFKGKKQLLIGGSTWPKEEEILRQFSALNKAYKIVLAPHDVSENHIAQIEKMFQGKSIRYSLADERDVSNFDVLIIDSIGILSSAYQYGDAALVGGGFSGALHNILEPLVCGNLVMFGPNHKKFHEAQDVIDNAAGYVIRSAEEIDLVLRDNLDSAREKNTKFIEERVGATSFIINQLK